MPIISHSLIVFPRLYVKLGIFVAVNAVKAKAKKLIAMGSRES
jgi:hypothetical protein